jgi:hypothetical protein
MAAEDFAVPAERAAGPAVRPDGGVTLGSPPARKLATGVLVAWYAWIAGASAPFSTRALIAVLIPGVLLGGIAYGRPPERIPAPESLDVAGFSYWIVALALLFEWEASAFRGGVAPWHPSLTELINPLIAPHPMRSAAFAVWLLAGWGLVKR